MLGIQKILPVYLPLERRFDPALQELAGVVMVGPEPDTGRPAIVVRWEVDYVELGDFVSLKGARVIPWAFFLREEDGEQRWALFGAVEVRLPGRRYLTLDRYFTCREKPSETMGKTFRLQTNALSNAVEEALEPFGVLQDLTPEGLEVVFIPHKDTEVFFFDRDIVVDHYIVYPVAFLRRQQEHLLLVEVLYDDGEEGPETVEYVTLN